MNRILICFITILSACLGYSQEKYFGLPVPGLVPEVFAPGIVSKPDRGEGGTAITKDGKIIYFTVHKKGGINIHRIRWDGKNWSESEIVVNNAHDPALSLDDTKLYFVHQKRPGSADIAYVELDSHSLQDEPILLDTPVNTSASEYYTSFTNTRDLVFASNRNNTKQQGSFDIFRAQIQNGKYVSVERFQDKINSKYYEVDAYISPDESYLIYHSSRPDDLGGSGLYASFATTDSGWTTAIPLGDSINGKEAVLCPFVTRDGRFLFFSRKGNIYWVDAKILDPLRKQVIQE